ncbi:MAG: Hsp20/alpha crystallin family protein [Pirellulaceae bacterium]|nr:Hsp20/alpha crystallin family protein [Pirellulaceae bacterium]
MFRSLSPWREGSLIPTQDRFTRSLVRFEEEMEDLMARMFGEGLTKVQFTPLADMKETDEAFELTLDLPGMTAEDIHVEVKEGDLWVTGERKEEQEEKGETFHRTERRYGHFRRMFSLPKTVREEKIEATFDKGVLKIVVPKSEEAKPRQIEVKA